MHASTFQKPSVHTHQPLSTGQALAHYAYNRIVSAPEPGVVLVEPLAILPAVEDVPTHMSRPVAAELQSLLDRYLKVTGFEAESVVRFERSGSNQFYEACINPALVAYGRTVGGSPRVFMGLINDLFNIHQLENAEGTR